MSILPDSSGGAILVSTRRHVENLTERFLKDCRDRGMTPESIQTYLWEVEDFTNFLGERTPEQANRADLKGYLDRLKERGVSKTTAGYYFSALKTFYDYMVFEDLIAVNPVDAIRKRYIQGYKHDSQGHTHQIISVDDAAKIISSLMDIRDKALVMLLFKTGVRRRELIAMDVEDINWKDQSIMLKPTAKRTNRIVFFDDEAAALLHRWLKAREMRAKPGEKALFIGTRGRLRQNGIQVAIVHAAKRVGLHNPASDDMEDHFSAHSCRHWFTTHLRRAGMPREFIQELRGDVRKEAIDIYDHIDKEELRKSYLAHVPQLGV